jgi:phospholipid-binding lipoprotein MlaA
VRAHRDSRSGVAFWGLPEGPFVYLPVFGPSDPRDAIGLAGNAVMDPFTWVGQGTTVRALDWSRMGVKALDQRERHLDDIDSTKKTALDPYATFRSLYRQHRRGHVDDLRKDTRATIPVWFPESGAPSTVTYSPAVSPAY